jgi:hypothetical protein
MPLILGVNSVTGGYEIDNSLRFNSGSSDYLAKNSWATATSDKIFTYSTWVKRSQLANTERLFGAFAGSPQVYSCDLSFTSNNGYIEFTFGGASAYDIVTNAMYRDTSAWYHVVLAVDTTQATASNRIIIYVNGTVQTLQTANYPPQNTTYQVFRNNNANLIGSAWNGGAYYSGYMSEVYFIDGQALAPSDFGEFDEDSGIWKPIAYEGTYGTNGFFLEFLDSSALGDDTSGNSNDFTVNNLTSIDQTTDTPTNNFSTLNPLNVNRWDNTATYSEGNLYFNSGNGKGYGFSTLGVTQGKWYVECKLATSSTIAFQFGVADMNDVNAFTIPWYDNSPSYAIGIQQNGTITYNNTATAYGDSLVDGDILSLALDMDNYAFYIAKNGVWQNSGDPTSGASKTGDVTTTASYNFLNSGEPMFIMFADTSTVGHGTCYMNFGNPPFTISSGNSDGNGYGNFEYTVPSGYYSLNTKNLAEFG